MTISELIQTLETIRDKQGDVILGQVDLFDGEDLILDYYDKNGEEHTIRVQNWERGKRAKALFLTSRS